MDVKRYAYRDVRYSLSQIQTALISGSPCIHNKRFLEPPNTILYNDFWHLDWDEFIVACDSHSPYIDERIFNLMLEVAQKYKIKKFCHAGDFWDQAAFSRFDIASEDTTSLTYDIGYSKKVVKLLTDQFDDTNFFLGSHDVRFWLMMLRQGKEMTFDDIWGLLENSKIKVSKYRYCEIGDEWRINHPKNIVRVGGLPAVRMGAKFARSIIFGHGHWWGQVTDPSGKHYLIAPGCLCNPERISYRSLWDTSHDEWHPGFLLVLDKKIPFLIDEKIGNKIFGVKV